MGPGVKWGLGGKKTGGEGQHDNDGGRAQPLLDVPSASHRPPCVASLGLGSAGRTCCSLRPPPSPPCQCGPPDGCLHLAALGSLHGRARTRGEWGKKSGAAHTGAHTGGGQGTSSTDASLAKATPSPADQARLSRWTEREPEVRLFLVPLSPQRPPIAKEGTKSGKGRQPKREDSRKGKREAERD